MTPRVLAVDWSGAAVGARKKIWLAEASADGRGLVRLENGRDRDALADHLIAVAEDEAALVVGLDFAFSLPAWFLDARGYRGAADLWAAADRDADDWLAAVEPPFWGRPGHPRPPMPSQWRRTEQSVPATGGVRPKSAFQVGGAGAVGTGSLRGMRLLHRLRGAGFSVWPFDPPGRPLLVEIYPRLLTGPVVKSDVAHRVALLERDYPGFAMGHAARAASSEDAFDAAVSALVMAAHRGAFARLPAVEDPRLVREGLIWYPGWERDLVATVGD